MAKKALYDVLEHTIGQFVKNLDAESLNVAVFKGKVELDSLELDADAVNAELDLQAARTPNLAVPFRVLEGRFSLFTIDVPWAHLLSRPVVFVAQGLHIQVEPYDRWSHTDVLQVPMDSEEERKKLVQQKRMESIQSAEEYRIRNNALKQLAVQDTSDGKTDNKASLGSRLVRRIVENLQIEIRDVHVSLQGAEYSAGLVLDSLLLATTDKDGKRTYVDREHSQESFLYKLLSIDGLGLYMDHDKTAEDHSYLLTPLNFQAKLRQADANECVDFPKYLLESTLPEMSIQMSKPQLDLTRALVASLNFSETGPRPLFPEYRPATRVHGHVKEWWKYAYHCVGRLNGRRSWAEFFRAFKRRQKYIPLYKRHAHSKTCNWLTKLSPSEQDDLAKLEQRITSVSGIMKWRDMADAQVERERAKYDARNKAKNKSLFQSVFGSKEKDADEEPPITLTTEELKELYDASMESAMDTELSDKSKLAHVQFIMGNFSIALTSQDKSLLTDFEMGVVSITLDANADGSLQFLFKLASLEINDHVTPDTLFPKVLRSLQRESADALNVRLEKDSKGSQNIQLRLVAIEAVASPLLIKELGKFAATVDTQQGKLTEHPEDPSYEPLITKTSAAEKATKEISAALIEAWKFKTVTRTSLVINLDVQAPIFVVPQNCVDPSADILFLDLGHLTIQYGTVEPSAKVAEWLGLSPSIAQYDQVLDSGSMEASEFIFAVAKVEDWIGSERRAAVAELQKKAIVEPISLRFDFGVQSRAGVTVPRVAVFGRIPRVSLRFSPAQLSRILGVYTSWTSLAKEIDTKPSQAPSGVSTSPKARQQDVLTRSIEGDVASLQEKMKTIAGSAAGVVEDAADVFHVDVGFHGFSMEVLNEAGDGLEVHLVSIFASLSSLPDGSSLSRLRMGWFWVLDRCQNDFPRRQRLLAHSTLPLDPHAFAADEKYDIMGELERSGVFDDNYTGSSELADIQLKQLPKPPLGSIIETSLLTENLAAEWAPVDILIEAKFTSFFFHWNPEAVKTLTGIVTDFSGTIGESSNSASLASSESIGEDDDSISQSKVSSSGALSVVLKARMKSVEVFLRSARDDLPLFILSLSDSVVSMVSDKGETDQNMAVSLDVGDLRIATPSMGRTQSVYRTLVGIAPGRSESLMSVKYYMGTRGVRALSLENINHDDCEACGEIDFAPVKMVFIQAQILALSDFVSNGILGALAAQTASVAASAVKDAAASNAGEKVFRVKLAGLEIVLPQAAYKLETLSLSSGVTEINYKAFSAPPGGGEASLSLSRFEISDKDGVEILQEPISLKIDVAIPPPGTGSKDDQAMKVGIHLSDTSFTFLGAQCEQIISTLKENFGEEDLCLRDETSSSTEDSVENYDEEKEEFWKGLSHSGVFQPSNPQRMYLTMTLQAFSIELFGVDMGHPLIAFMATKCIISQQTLPDEGKSSSRVVLNNVVCEDRRFETAQRHFRTMFSTVVDDRSKGGDNTDATNFFCLSFEQINANLNKLDVEVGSFRFVFIPDLMAEVSRVLGLKSEDITKEGEARKGASRQISRMSTGSSDEGDEDPNMALLLSAQATEPDKSTSLVWSVKTLPSSIVLVDVGSEAPRSSVVVNASSHLRSLAAQMPEAIVVCGNFDCSGTFVSDIGTGQMVKTEAEMQGNGLEIFSAFGDQLWKPLQILEPTKLFGALSISPAEGGGTEIDIKTSALAPIDMTLSLQGVALFIAVMSALSESSSSDKVQGEEQKTEAPQTTEDLELAEQEVERIENLISILNEDGSVEVSRKVSSLGPLSVSTKPITSDVPTASLVCSLHMAIEETTTVTFFNDLQGLDEALFRFTVSSFTIGGEVKQGKETESSTEILTTFDVNVYTSFLADYFDSTVNLWRQLLKKPWDISFSGIRGYRKDAPSNGMSTKVDIESSPCSVTLSKEFLAGLANAAGMWAAYSSAVISVVSLDQAAGDDYTQARKLYAANAARNLITSLPYAILNNAGVDVYFLPRGSGSDRLHCPNGTKQYFGFDTVQGAGFGGKRLCGQDLPYRKSVSLFIGDSVIAIQHLDSEVNRSRRAHDLGNGRVVFTDVVKDKTSTVVHLTNMVELYNHTQVPFKFFVEKNSQAVDAGVCLPAKRGPESPKPLPATNDAGGLSRQTRKLGILAELFDDFGTEWQRRNRGDLTLFLSPQIDDSNTVASLRGKLHVQSSREKLLLASRHRTISRFDVTCGTEEGMKLSSSDPFVVHVYVEVSLIEDKFPYITIALEPRAVIANNLPVAISIRTYAPYTFSNLSHGGSENTEVINDASQSGRIEVSSGSGEVVHELDLGGRVEVFSPGKSISVSAKCSNKPEAGTVIDWTEWADLPLLQSSKLSRPLLSRFPFDLENPKNTFKLPFLPGKTEGLDLAIVQGSVMLAELSFGAFQDNPKERKARKARQTKDEPLAGLFDPNVKPAEDGRTFFFTVFNFAIDHTGEFLFEKTIANPVGAGVIGIARNIPGLKGQTPQDLAMPFSAFQLGSSKQRLSLLPHSGVAMRLFHSDANGTNRSKPLRIEDIAISSGGLDCTPVQWEKNTMNKSYYAYRRLVNVNQSEVHLIPGYIVFNGSKTYKALLMQPGLTVELGPGQIAPIWSCSDKNDGLIVSIAYVELGGQTPQLRVDERGMRLAVVEGQDGRPIACLAVQTAVGSRDSRMVIKLGEIDGSSPDERPAPVRIDVRDDVKFRVKWPELELTLTGVRELDDSERNSLSFLYAALDRVISTDRPSSKTNEEDAGDSQVSWVEKRTRQIQEQLSDLHTRTQELVGTFILREFSLSWQRICDDDDNQSDSDSKRSLLSERNEFFIRIEDMILKDEALNSPFPVVFDSSSETCFFDLVVRLLGPLDGDFINVDLMHMKLAHHQGKTERIFVRVSEGFLWKILSTMDQIQRATEQHLENRIETVLNDNGRYVAAFATDDSSPTGVTEEEVYYEAPKSDILLKIVKAQVSPFIVVASFRPTPESQDVQQNVEGAGFVNFLAHRLRIEKAELEFKRFVATDLKGPPDRLVDELRADYTRQFKQNFLKVLTATRFDER